MKPHQICPHCHQTMMVYKRQIRPNMLRCLVKLYQDFGYRAVEVSEISKEIREITDFPKLRHWGLIQKVGSMQYQITERGIEFIQGYKTVKKYVWIYNKEVLSDPPDVINPVITARQIDPDFIDKTAILRRARPAAGFGHPEFSFKRTERTG